MNWMKLRRLIDTHFNDDELRTLCFDLEIDYESLGGEGKRGKIRELLNFMRRYHRVDELIHYLGTERPEVPWPDVSADTAQEGTGKPLGEGLENPLRIAVWNALHRTLWSKKTFLHSYKNRPPLIEKFSEALWADFINKPVDARPRETTQILQEIRGCFFTYDESTWRAFLEYILNYWNNLDYYKPSPINRAVNAALEREEASLKYSPQYVYNRFTSGAIVEVGSMPSSNTVSSTAMSETRSTATLDIPDSISKIIYRQAERRYPNDFSMRKYVIEKETQAWRTLETYLAPEVPDHILTLIFQQAEKRYPDDFSMRKYVIENEVQAWRVLQAYHAPGVPEETLAQIFQQAEKRYPDNFSMQKYIIEKEVQAWRELPQK